MAGIDKRLTDLTELASPPDTSWIHVVDPTDISQHPDGSSYKVKKENFGGLSDAPSNGTTYGRKDAAWVAVSSTDVTADHFRGNWNASTNTPTLANAIGQIGDYYKVTVEGTLFGRLWKVGDYISYSGSVWQLFVDNNQSPVLTTNFNITSANLTTQDVSGFVAYINGLVSSFSLAVNEIGYWTVTDTGQKFQLLLRGRSFGGSEPDITTSDVLELERPISGITIIAQSLSDSSAVTGTTANVFPVTVVIPANTFKVGDIIEIKQRLRKTGANGVVSARNIMAGNTTMFAQSAAAGNLAFEITRNFFVKSATNTESIAAAVSTFISEGNFTTFASMNIDWTVSQNIQIGLNNNSALDSTVISGYQITRYRL